MIRTLIMILLVVIGSSIGSIGIPDLMQTEKRIDSAGRRVESYIDGDRTRCTNDRCITVDFSMTYVNKTPVMMTISVIEFDISRDLIQIMVLDEFRFDERHIPYPYRHTGSPQKPAMKSPVPIDSFGRARSIIKLILANRERFYPQSFD